MWTERLLGGIAMCGHVMIVGVPLRELLVPCVSSIAPFALNHYYCSIITPRDDGMICWSALIWAWTTTL